MYSEEDLEELISKRATFVRDFVNDSVLNQLKDFPKEKMQSILQECPEAFRFLLEVAVAALLLKKKKENKNAELN